MKSRCRYLFTLLGIVLFSDLGYAQANTITPNVKHAMDRTSGALNTALSSFHLDLSKIDILIVAYKHEQELIVYVKGKSDTTYRYFKYYKICQSSGALGPKRAEGDYQVPEGFYAINFFNPFSSYHLSLGIDYPNQSDRMLSTARRLGGEIFIHGECVTVGCLPMTNEKIEEIYTLASKADSSGQKNIPVYIFPFKFSEPYADSIKASYVTNPSLVAFWDNLKTGYDKFLSTRLGLTVSVSKRGKYEFH